MQKKTKLTKKIKLETDLTVTEISINEIAKSMNLDLDDYLLNPEKYNNLENEDKLIEQLIRFDKLYTKWEKMN